MTFQNRLIKQILPLLIVVALALSFWHSKAWLQLCYGLALFLFGMQCIEEGLHNAAGGTLERMMSRFTATPVKGLLFGIVSTFILQSSTLMSLLTIAFLSTGLITLAGGLAIIFGTNLGSTSGIWFLALAGQSVSLSPAAIPMLVFGILIGFFNQTAKAVGRVLIGISLIFLGIDAIKTGFQAFGGQVDFASMQWGGMTEILVFSFIGFVLTCVLQSSHATLILTLAALANGQISMVQGFAIAVGSNVGSSASTALVGMLGSERSGQRLALAHLLFNSVTTLLSFVLWIPLTKSVAYIGESMNWSPLIQLALFHTMFNALGVAIFWKPQKWLADKLVAWLPEKASNNILPSDSNAIKPLYLNKNMLVSSDTAIRAVYQEMTHLNNVGLEVMCHAIFVPTEKLYAPRDSKLPEPVAPLELNVQTFYEWQIKPLYSELLDFTSKIDVQEHADHQEKLTVAHVAAFQLIEIVKESKHLQKNMQQYLLNQNTSIYYDYAYIREHVLGMLQRFYDAKNYAFASDEWNAYVTEFTEYVEQLETHRQRVLIKLRKNELDSWQVSSLMNDINYARRIGLGLLEILHLSGNHFAQKEPVSETQVN